VRPFLDASYSSTAKAIVAVKPPPFLVGMLFYARRLVHVRTMDTLAGDAKLSFGNQLLNKLGLGSTFKASVNGGDNSANTVDLVGTSLVPVAFAPAFVVTSTTKLTGGKVKYEVASVNQADVEEKIRLARLSEDRSYAVILKGLEEAIEHGVDSKFAHSLLQLDPRTFSYTMLPKTGDTRYVTEFRSKPDVLRGALGCRDTYCTM